MMELLDTCLQDTSCGSQETTETSQTADVIGQQSTECWSFETIYKQYQHPIYRYLLSMLTSPMQAEDLTQEVFLRVWRALPRMSAGCNISAWLYRVARNSAIDILRRRRLIAWSSLEAEMFEKESDASLDPQMRYEGVSEEVVLALERMPPKAREALVLYELEGASYSQLAHQLHIAPKGVKMSLTRARKRFKQHYRDVRKEAVI